MFQITMQHPIKGQRNVVLKTENKKLCRGLTELAIQNDLNITTVVSAEPVRVSFKDMEDTITPEADPEPNPTE